MQKIVILGSQGMLGQELVALFQTDNQYQVQAFDIKDLDVTHWDLLREKLAEISPDIVINAVGYNAVDLAEESDEEFAKAKLLNTELPARLAQLSSELHFVLVHYSTDYVFDGTLEPPQEKQCQGACCGGNCHGTKKGYDENALPNPLSKYAETKFLGEQAIPAATQTYYLIRLSKLFGKPAVSEQGKKSFFATMLDLGKSNQSAGGEVRAIDSEMSCFTYAPDLARATKELLESKDPSGIYHLVNEGGVTWYEGVLELYRKAGITTKVTPVKPEAFPRSAKRPAFSVLVNTKRPKLRHYTEALVDFLK